MKKTNRKKEKVDMLDEYDFSVGIRGKHFKRYKEGSSVVALDHDVAEVFHDRTSVNQALLP